LSKRLQYSRWRRLPKVYRSGEYRIPEAPDESLRLTLYIPAHLLDAAEVQAERAGVGTVQDYCADLLIRAIESQRIQEQVAEVEARRGPLEGFQEIANDAEYLAEWNALASGLAVGGLGSASAPSDPDSQQTRFRLIEEPALLSRTRPSFGGPPHEGEVTESSGSNPPSASAAPEQGGATDMPEQPPTIEPPPAATPPPASLETTAGSTRPLSAAAMTVLRHSGQAGVEDPMTFLSALRRGEAVAASEVAELTRALTALEEEYRDCDTIDRRLAYALHRLAFEAQVLHTDAWSGTFDAWTVSVIRNVQEAVDRILSGQDIHYYPTDEPKPENLL
jgi:hypothetical protein